MISGEMIRSFRRSRTRLTIIKYLNGIYPEGAYLSEIARNISSDPSNTRGCVLGLGIRYTVSESLVAVGLVEEYRKGDSKYYRIGDKAKVDEIIRMFPVKRIVDVEI